MENFKEKEYKVFEMFDKQWAVVTAGSMEHCVRSFHVECVALLVKK